MSAMEKADLQISSLKGGYVLPITDNSNHLVAGTLSDCMRLYVNFC